MKIPLCLCIPFISLLSGVSGDIVITQDELSNPVTSGESVSISCRSSKSLLYKDGKTYLNWFLQRPGQSPQLLIYYATAWEMGSHQGSVAVNLAHSIPSRSAACSLKILQLITVNRVTSVLSQ